MKQITEEQGLDLIKKFQDKTFIDVPINEEEIYSFKQICRESSLPISARHL